MPKRQNEEPVANAVPSEQHAHKLERKTMHRLSSLKLRLRVGVGLGLVVAGIYGLSITLATGADTKLAENKPADKSAAHPDSGKKADPKPEKKKAAKKLTGAELYAINCNRCHPERYPTEWTSAQWKTLMTHMRVRANLPAEQAKEILKYLQEDSGN
jgi:hypothetical protein